MFSWRSNSWNNLLDLLLNLKDIKLEEKLNESKENPDNTYIEKIISTNKNDKNSITIKRKTDNYESFKYKSENYSDEDILISKGPKGEKKFKKLNKSHKKTTNIINNTYNSQNKIICNELEESDSSNEKNLFNTKF